MYRSLLVVVALFSLYFLQAFNSVGDLTTHELTLLPPVVDSGHVESSFRPVQGGIIAIVTVSGFYQTKDGPSTEHDIVNALTDLKKNGSIKGLILDLRDCHGGLLAQAVEVAGVFMKCGVVAVSKDGYSKLHFMRQLKPFPKYTGPLVILTSQHTAGAAEVVAAALQDYGLAIVVGDPETFGKRSLQPHAGKKGPFQRFYSVSGRSLQQDGVAVDIVVPSIITRAEGKPEVYTHDSIDPSYTDALLDVPRQGRSWFRKYYLPFMQQKTQMYTKRIPELAQVSQKRLASNTKYQQLLKGDFAVVMQEGQLQKKVLLSHEEATKELRDMQLEEAIAITKNLLTP